MQKSELTGAKLKRDLGLEKAHYRWHNKNLSGGNFGINLRTGGSKDYELTGHYDTSGRIVILKFGEIYQMGVHLRNAAYLTYGQLVAKLKDVLAVAQDGYTVGACLPTG